MSASARLTRATLGLALALLACARGRHPETGPAPQPAPAEGRVGYSFLRDPGGPTPTMAAGQDLSPPAAHDTPLPEYPRQALVRGAPPVTLIVRIIVEEDGRVREVIPSPLDRTEASVDRAPFRAAVEEAVRRWRFSPASIRTFSGRDVDGDGVQDYQVLDDQRPVRTFLDLRFTFEVVDGEGRVRVGQGR